MPKLTTIPAGDERVISNTLRALERDRAKLRLEALKAAQLALESAMMLMNQPQPGMPPLPDAWKKAFWHNCGFQRVEATARDAIRG